MNRSIVEIILGGKINHWIIVFESVIFGIVVGGMIMFGMQSLEFTKTYFAIVGTFFGTIAGAYYREIAVKRKKECDASTSNVPENELK